MTHIIKALPLQYFLFLLLFHLSIGIYAQDSRANIDPVYGYDPLLFNGKVYSFTPIPGTSGTQYLFDDFDPKGSIDIRNVTFSDVSLNFDLYNKKFVQQYKNTLGTLSYVEISVAWLESITIHGKQFKILQEADSTERIYQIIGEGNTKILYYYHKGMLVDNSKSIGKYVFTKSTKEMFVKGKDVQASFKSNRSFIRTFNLGNQKTIKGYLRKYSINVRKANDQTMKDLINYCNTLTGS